MTVHIMLAWTEVQSVVWCELGSRVVKGCVYSRLENHSKLIPISSPSPLSHSHPDPIAVYLSPFPPQTQWFPLRHWNSVVTSHFNSHMDHDAVVENSQLSCVQ